MGKMNNFKPQRRLIEPTFTSWYVIKVFFIACNVSLLILAGLLIAECVTAGAIIRLDPHFVHSYELLHPERFYVKGKVDDSTVSLALMIPSVIFLFIQSFIGISFICTVNLKVTYVYTATMYLTFIILTVTLFIGKRGGPFLIAALVIEPFIFLFSNKIIALITDFNGIY